MARLCGACCGLLIFSAMVLMGLATGITPDVILRRALVGLFAGIALGGLAGLVGQIVLSQPHPTAPEEASRTERDEAPGESSRIVS